MERKEPTANSNYSTHCNPSHNLESRLGDFSQFSNHGDTQFDSSTDETVIPYTARDRSSLVSADRFDPEASPRSFLSRRTRYSIDTEQCGTLYEESVAAEIVHVPTSMAVEHENCEVGEDVRESQRLVSTDSQSPSSGHLREADYRVGSCYHCLISIPVGSLLAWILAFIAAIGWSTSTWLSLSKGKDLLKWIQQEDLLTYEEIALIAIALVTLFIIVVYLVIATFTSQKMSRYTFSTSKKNTFGYCLSLMVVVFSFISVLFWTAIVALTMVPIAALAIIHILVESQGLDCLHLQSYGIGMKPMFESMVTNGSENYATTMSLFDSANLTSETISVGLMMNSTRSIDHNLLCGSELDDWMESAWKTLVPLLVSLVFAVAIEAAMLGFMIAASSNARHLKERMEYITEPYSYSTENLNGNVKTSSTKESNPTHNNNNHTDTQI